MYDRPRRKIDVSRFHHPGSCAGASFGPVLERLRVVFCRFELRGILVVRGFMLLYSLYVFFRFFERGDAAILRYGRWACVVRSECFLLVSVVLFQEV